MDRYWNAERKIEAQEETIAYLKEMLSIVKQELENERKKSEQDKASAANMRKQMQIEITLHKELSKRNAALAEKCRNDLKVVLSVTRIPRLTTIYQTVLRKKEGQKLYDQRQNLAQSKILEEAGKESEETYLEEFVNNLGMIPDMRRPSSPGRRSPGRRSPGKQSPSSRGRGSPTRTERGDLSHTEFNRHAKA